MVRLSDVTANERSHLENLDCPSISPGGLQPARPLTECRVALISSAGLMQRNDDNIPANTGDYRVIEPGVDDADILMNHVSVNFDRTAFAEDINCVLPRARLKAMAATGQIAAAAAKHYSFMGATPPQQMQPHVERLSKELIEAGINTVCLLPV